jgi:hypothetical protein
LLNVIAPVRFAVIDVAGPLADIDCGRAEQPLAYLRARRGRPPWRR